MLIDQHAIAQQEKRYRVNFINSLSGLKTAWLVGSRSPQGEDNLALFSSIVHLGADPALIGMVSRPDVVPRGTLDNIRSSGVYTLSLATEEFYRQAHQTSARYLPGESEFVATGLTAQTQAGFAAPHVAQSPLAIGMALRQIVDIELNNTHFIIGEVQWVDVPQGAIAGDGLVNAGALQPALVGGLDYYHRAVALQRLPYAKRPQG
ncbi:MAG TPA: flavin reductase [Pseudomonadales bacterium]